MSVSFPCVLLVKSFMLELHFAIDIQQAIGEAEQCLAGC